ncbi:MAG: toll/interleukin-1 receptor domain-containing protein [Bacteroidia bacterium]|nr:toll/interleukin-1 receptor domain-containing protein [Bacteroidia bacterium]
METNKPLIFISYSRLNTNKESDDRKNLIKNIKLIKEQGFNTFFDVENLNPAAKWAKQINKAIINASLVIFYVSLESLKSLEVKKEVTRAIKLKKKILPILIKSDAETEFSKRPDLADFQALYMYNNGFEEQLKAFLMNFLKIPKDIYIMGLGKLPSNKEIASGKVKLDENEQITRMLDNINLFKPKRSYTIPHIFQLTSTLTNAIENLEIRSKNWKWGKDTFTNLLSKPITIEECYLSPLFLLTGLITRVADNWPPIINAYVTLCKKNIGSLDDFHYFVEFCWLSWGPSIDTSFLLNDESYEYMIAQVSTGDEANSLPLVIRKENWRKCFSEEYQNRKSGWPLKLKNLILINLKKDKFFSKIYKHHIFQNINNEDNEFLLPEIALFYTNKSNKIFNIWRNKPYYNSAYVWLILEQVKMKYNGKIEEKKMVKLNNDDFKNISVEALEDGKIYCCEKMEPGLVLPFFEHANIASRLGLEFLQGCLVRKALHHILECEEVEAYKEQGYYMFSIALFDDDIEKILEKQIEELDNGEKIIHKRFVILNKNERRQPSDVIDFVSALHKRVNESTM